MDELDDFFLDMIERANPPAREKSSIPDMATISSVDELAELLPDPEPEPLLEPPEDPEVRLEELLRKFPEACPQYLQKVVASSKHHVWAMLKDKVDSRVDTLIHRFLRQGGIITSHERYETKGNGVDWTYLRDTGLITKKTASAEAGGYRYELCLETFDFSRGTRADLTSKDRRTLFELSGFKCNRCGSSRDLQADHRVGVAIGGGDAGGDLSDFQTLCRLCNLNKRVACELCQNRHQLDVEMCRTCAWAYPKNHTHTAGEIGTRVTLRLLPGTQERARELLEAEGLLA